MDNLEEMERFLEKFNLPRLNQEETEIVNNPISSTEIEAVIKKKKSLPPNENTGPDSFSGEFYQTCRGELMPILLKLFQKLQRKEHFQTHSYEAIITLIQKSGKDNTKNENYRPISLMNIDTNILNKI